MENSTPTDPLDLPQSQDTWHLAVRRLRAWIIEEDETIIRPYLIAVIDQHTGIIRENSISADPTPQEVLETLFSAMPKSQPRFMIQPERPARVFFEDRELTDALYPELQEIGVDARWRSQKADLDDLVAELEARMLEGRLEIPGLLAQEGVKPSLVGSLFSAAAGFYRAAPWVQLANEDLLAITIPPQQEPYYVIVMGQGGVEYGLALYKNWEAVLSQYGPYDSPDELIAPEGRHALLFDEAPEVPFDDLDDQVAYGWELPNPQIYPVPMIFVSRGEVHRPGKDDILWYEAALRAIPRFVEEHLSLDEAGQPQPAEAQIQVTTAARKVSVMIRYPGGELPKERGTPSQDFDLDVDDSFEPPFDRRGMEGDMVRMLGDLGESEREPKLIAAQEMMYEAWEETNPARRFALAYKALNLSPDCADAYVLLAEEEADTVARAFKFYQQGVDAGRRALGEDYFKDNAGYFWGLLDTRPYMRAMEGLASCMRQLKREEEALEMYQEMLRLNPSDNQGIRYILADLLLSLNRDEALEGLLQQYQEESAAWLYTHALLAFRKSGDADEANRALQAALEENVYVPGYLTANKRLPNRLPDYIGIGDDNEAVIYAAHHLNYWRRTQGAVEWLQDQLTQTLSPTAGDTAKRKRSKRDRKSKGSLKPGDTVVVKPGIIDPDFKMDISGWQGRVEEVDERGEVPLVVVQWDSLSLAELPTEMINKCEQQDLAWWEMHLLATHIRLAEPRDTPDERDEAFQELSRRFAWAYLGEQGQRIQSVLGNIDPEDNLAALKAWESHLRRRLKFPFEAKKLDFIENDLLRPEDRVNIVGIDSIDSDFGIMIQVERKDFREVFPLFDLEVVKQNTANYRRTDDYITWFINR